MRLGQPRERPVRGGILGADGPRRDRGPDPGQRQDPVARVASRSSRMPGDRVEGRAAHIVWRHGIEDCGRRRPEQRSVGCQDTGDQEREVRVRLGRRQLAAFVVGAHPLAVLEVPDRRVPPGTDLGLDDDGQLDRSAVRPAGVGDGHQPIDQRSPFGQGRRPTRDREHVDVASWSEPTDDGRAFQVDTDDGLAEDLADDAGRSHRSASSASLGGGRLGGRGGELGRIAARSTEGPAQPPSSSLSMSRVEPKRTAVESSAGPSTRSSSRSVTPSAHETYSTSASGSVARTSRMTPRSASPERSPAAQRSRAASRARWMTGAARAFRRARGGRCATRAPGRPARARWGRR